jgi:hypothetical protein
VAEAANVMAFDSRHHGNAILVRFLDGYLHGKLRRDLAERPISSHQRG